MKTPPKPVRIPYDHTGQCDNCGKDLGAYAFRLGESTGCTAKCAREDYVHDVTEWKNFVEWEQGGDV